MWFNVMKVQCRYLSFHGTLLDKILIMKSRLKEKYGLFRAARIVGWACLRGWFLCKCGWVVSGMVGCVAQKKIERAEGCGR